MAERASRSVSLAALGSMGWPVFLGGWATAFYFLLVFRGPLRHEFLLRYTAGHPINMIEVALFFIALAALGCKLISVAGEMNADAAIELPEAVEGESTDEACEAILQQLESLPQKVQNTYLGRRLKNVAQTIARRGLADGVDEDLRYYADLDVASQQESYGLVRIAIWAIPMLGFLGTVIGITLALGDFGASLSSGESSGDLNQSMRGLLSGLYVAFDTTALALALSMVLMFVQFMIERVEGQLLASVDERAARELAGRFEQLGASRDPVVAAVTRMSGTLVQSIETLGKKQAEAWAAASEETGRLFAQSLSETLEGTLGQFAQAVSGQEAALLDQLQTRLGYWQAALEKNAELLAAQQQEILRQSELLAQVASATGDVARLEAVLNRNLETLAGSKNFEDTVVSLSAAIQLLTTRLKQGATPSVELPASRKQRDKAA